MGPFSQTRLNLAAAFGALPPDFRGGLGLPRGGVLPWLEIGKLLEGNPRSSTAQPGRPRFSPRRDCPAVVEAIEALADRPGPRFRATAQPTALMGRCAILQ